MRKALLTLVACVGFVLPAYVGQCADNAGLLDDLDWAMETEKAKVEAEADDSLPAQLKRNLDLKIRLRGYSHFQSAPEVSEVEDQDRQNTFGEAKISFGSRYENDNILVAGNAWVQVGNENDTYKGDVGFWQDKDRRRNYIQVNELYAAYIGGAVDVTVGKKLLENSISTIYSPANRYNSYDFTDPIDPEALGVWQIAFEGDASDVAWKVAVLPVFQPPKTPSETSRWIANDSSDNRLASYYNGSTYSSEDEFLEAIREQLFFFNSVVFGGDNTFRDWVNAVLADYYDYSVTGNESVTVKQKYPNPGDMDGNGFFGQAKTSVGDFDLMASMFRGPSVYPVLHVGLDEAAQEIILTVEHPVVNQVAGGFSTVHGDWEFHGEALYNISDDDKDDSYVQYVFGPRWTNESIAEKIGLYRLDAGIEYAGEAITERQSKTGYAVSSQEIRIGRNDIIIGLGIHFTEDWRFKFLNDLELSKGTQMYRGEVEWDVTEHLTADAAVEIFEGPRKSYWGYWRNQDRVVTSITYKF